MEDSQLTDHQEHPRRGDKMSDNFQSNTPAERVKFNRMVQGDNDTTADFIDRLCRQAEYCGYNNKEWKDENIRDRLLAGLQDKCLSEILLLIPDLTLHQARSAASKYKTDTRSNPKVEMRVEAGIHGGQGTTGIEQMRRTSGNMSTDDGKAWSREMSLKNTPGPQSQNPSPNIQIKQQQAQGNTSAQAQPQFGAPMQPAPPLQQYNVSTTTVPQAGLPIQAAAATNVPVQMPYAQAAQLQPPAQTQQIEQAQANVHHQLLTAQQQPQAQAAQEMQLFIPLTYGQVVVVANQQQAQGNTFAWQAQPQFGAPMQLAPPLQQLPQSQGFVPPGLPTQLWGN